MREEGLGYRAISASLFLTWLVVGSTSSPRLSRAWRPKTLSSPSSAKTTVVGAISPSYSTHRWPTSLGRESWLEPSWIAVGNRELVLKESW